MNYVDTPSNDQECRDTNLIGNQSTKWTRWSEELWDEAERGWLTRNGQDHFYRETVVIPALVRAFDLRSKRPLSIVDLGCGDGHSASLLLADLKRRQLSASVTLVDRSPRLLSAAQHDPILKSATVIQAEFGSVSWSRQLPDLQQPTVFLAVFLLQELPDLGHFFHGLSDLMSAEDRLLAVVPDPDYAESLRRSSRVTLVATGSRVVDWRWAGEYPISTHGKPLALPHFQRAIEDYRRAACRWGLELIGQDDLCVQDTPSAYKMFADTVYGCAIIGRPSAKLLTFASVDANQ